jgi:hypothetical protein
MRYLRTAYYIFGGLGLSWMAYDCFRQAFDVARGSNWDKALVAETEKAKADHGVSEEA